MKMLRLPRSKVRLGQAVPWNVYEQSGTLLLRRGNVVYNEHQLELLLKRGAYVDAQELVAGRDDVVAPAPAAVVRQHNLFDLWDQTTEKLHRIAADVSAHAGFAAQLERFVLEIVALVDRNPEIAIYRAVRQESAKAFYYGYSHSVHTAMMSILLSRHLGWEQQRMLVLVRAALTMNLSILELQGQMASQDVPMRERQRIEIHAHPVESVRMLQAAGVADSEWLQTVAQHHERTDGSGYPHCSTDVAEIAVALRVCDVLMAKISPRILRPALSPQEAARHLFREDKGGPLSTAMIQVLGIHPPGDFVRLASGELAVVVQRTGNVRAPIVATITDSGGHASSHTLRRDSAEPAYAIIGNATGAGLLARLPPERFYGFAEVVVSTAPSA